MIKRFGESPERGQTYRIRPGAYAILERGGRILLTHQAAPVPEFQLPGGGIDAGEHMLAALHREVLEETGYSISKPTRLGAFRRFVFMPDYRIWAEKICHVFSARPASRICAPLEVGHTVHWMSSSQAIEAIRNPGDRAFLTAHLSG